jgi:GNAT superfamily N-acetyltransferase
MREHCSEAHAELSLSEQAIGDFVDAALRTGPARPRVETINRVEVRALTPEAREDFLRFFDYEAFADNPAWAACYCVFFHCPGGCDAWEGRGAAENRAAAEAGIVGGTMHGYLAYADGQPAAWCNAGPRSIYPRIMEDEARHVDDAEQVGAIVCFVVAPPYRKHGLARRLLDAAVDGFRAQGLAIAEAYPTTHTPEHDADAFHGPPSLYDEAGFMPYREVGRQTIVRKALA